MLKTLGKIFRKKQTNREKSPKNKSILKNPNDSYELTFNDCQNPERSFSFDTKNSQRASVTVKPLDRNTRNSQRYSVNDKALDNKTRNSQYFSVIGKGYDDKFLLYHQNDPQVYSTVYKNKEFHKESSANVLNMSTDQRKSLEKEIRQSISPSTKNISLSQPTLMKWQNMDAYIYRVQSSVPEEKPDLEFVIYIPIDTNSFYKPTQRKKSLFPDEKLRYGQEDDANELKDMSKMEFPEAYNPNTNYGLEEEDDNKRDIVKWKKRKSNLAEEEDSDEWLDSEKSSKKKSSLAEEDPGKKDIKNASNKKSSLAEEDPGKKDSKNASNKKSSLAEEDPGKKDSKNANNKKSSLAEEDPGKKDSKNASNRKSSLAEDDPGKKDSKNASNRKTSLAEEDPGKKGSEKPIDKTSSLTEGDAGKKDQRKSSYSLELLDIKRMRKIKTAEDYESKSGSSSSSNHLSDDIDYFKEKSESLPKKSNDDKKKSSDKNGPKPEKLKEQKVKQPKITKKKAGQIISTYEVDEDEISLGRLRPEENKKDPITINRENILKSPKKSSKKTSKKSSKKS